MMSFKGELKIIGPDPLFICLGLTAICALLARYGGELLDMSCLVFEVIFPFFGAIAVGEWGKSRADDNFDIIAAQGKSLFGWVLARFAAIFALVSLFALVNMAIVFLLRREMPLGQLALTWLSPALLLASLAALLNLCFSAEHISALICGGLWLVAMLTRSLPRIPGLEYMYLFIRYAGDPNDIWLINKLLLLAVSLLLWLAVYVLTRRGALSWR